MLALIFGAGVFHFLGAAAGHEFFTGYLIEKSLSVDNLFVFVLLFSHFAVPAQYQHRVLLWGILGALVMLTALILLGAAVVQAFHWVIYLFCAFLIFTGDKMLATINQTPDVDNICSQPLHPSAFPGYGKIRGEQVPDPPQRGAVYDTAAGGVDTY